MLTGIRNRINHVILNRLMVMRYRFKNRPAIVKCLLTSEIVLIKCGVLYQKREAPSSGGHN